MIMKKFHFIILSLMLLCACAQEGPDNSAPKENLVKVRLSTDSAPEIFLAPETRTMLDEDLNVNWQTGDEVVLFDGSTPYKLTNVNADGPEAVFEGEVPDKWIKDNLRCVMYSYKAQEWNDKGEKMAERAQYGKGMQHVIMPSEQPLLPGTFARDYNLSAAGFKFRESASLYFKNLGGLLKVDMKGNVTVESVKMTAPGDINGTFVFYMSGTGDEAKVIMTMEESSKNPMPSRTVTLVSEEGVALNEEYQSFYACVLPCSAIGDYTVEVRTREGKTFTYTVPDKAGFGTGKISYLGGFDLLYTFADADGTSVTVDPLGQVPYEFIYDTSKGEPQITAKPDWLTVVMEDGRILLSADRYFAADERSGSLTIVQGATSSTITVVQKSVPAFDFDGSLEFKWEADTRDIAKTENLTGEYTAEPADPVADSWITPVVTSSGLTIAVAENNTGVPREGVVDVKIGGEVIARIPVKQMNKYEYESLLGEYEIIFLGANVAVTTPTQITGTFTISEKEAGVSYEAILHSDLDVNSGKGFNYPIELLYNASDTNPLTLVCPQFNGKRVHSSFYSWVRVAKKPSEEKFKLKVSDTEDNSAAIDVLAEGAGYDLILDDSDGTVKLDFVPNAIAQEAAPGGLAGLWFPWRRTEADEGPYVRVKDWVMPLAGQDYLRIVKK